MVIDALVVQVKRKGAEQNAAGQKQVHASSLLIECFPPSMGVGDSWLNAKTTINQIPHQTEWTLSVWRPVGVFCSQVGTGSSDLAASY